MSAIVNIATVGKKQASERDKRLGAIKSPYGLRDMPERLAWARVRRNLTVNELDKLAGLKTYVSNVETGKRKGVSLPILANIARQLGVTLDWLVNGSVPAYLKDLPAQKPNLDAALGALNRGGRWREETIAAARALDGDMDAARWPGALDVIQAAIDSFRS